MSRVAYVMNDIMNRLGLSGRAFIPMILGFGCNVPGIMAARTLDNEKDRLVTILACPFMSCGARLPVYTLLIAAFFGASGHGGTVLFGVYLFRYHHFRLRRPWSSVIRPLKANRNRSLWKCRRTTFRP